MSCSTVVIVSCYWLVTGIETSDLIAIDIVSAAFGSLHAVVSSAAIIAIASILSCSYAVVTLCSFISPSDTASNTRTHLPSFDGLYRVIVGAAGILFAEIPLVVVRSQVIATYDHRSSTSRQRLPVVFILWLVKDATFISISMVLVVIYLVKARRKVDGLSCDSCGRVAFDNPDVFFAPEKRDTYIAEQHRLTAPGVRREVPDVRRESPAARRQLIGGESHAPGQDRDVKASTSTGRSSSSADAIKRPRKSVTFRLDVDEGGSPKHSIDTCRPTYDDDSDSSV